MIQRKFTENGKTIVFYKENNEKKYSFLIENEPELTEFLLRNCKTKKVEGRRIGYAVLAIFSKLEFGIVDIKLWSKPMVKLSKYVQKRWGENLKCEVVQKLGPAHSPSIVVKLTLPNGDCYTGSGSNQRIARQLAATAAIYFLGTL